MNSEKDSSLLFFYLLSLLLLQVFLASRPQGRREKNILQEGEEIGSSFLVIRGSVARFCRLFATKRRQKVTRIWSPCPHKRGHFPAFSCLVSSLPKKTQAGHESRMRSRENEYATSATIRLGTFRQGEKKEVGSNEIIILRFFSLFSFFQ